MKDEIAGERIKRVTTQPQPVQIQIAFSDYVERVRFIELDKWQKNLCQRLQDALANRHIKGTRALVHGFPQSGKSVLIAQSFPAYIFGHDPLHRFRLATYNIMRSVAHSDVVQNIMRSHEHKGIFPNRDGHIPNVTRGDEWSTNARIDYNDGQFSFAALGLQSGFTGTGADTLLMDDPYRSIEEALSDTIRDKTGRFFTDTAKPRMTEYSNIFGMFHRYHQDDMAGRLLATGEFDYWRYAAECDGDYVCDETGIVYKDPLGREEGELISNRFTKYFFGQQKKETRVWLSQFQGRPTADSGAMFDITKLKEHDSLDDVPELLYQVRAWDNAATEGAGAYTVGLKMGIDIAGDIWITDMKREQVGTAEREILQKKTAEADGKLVAVHAPQDPGSAGKDVAFQFEQMLRDYNVITEVVSGSKEMRAYPFSVSVNRGGVHLVGDWDKKAFKTELKNFPLGTYKDIVDAGSDGDTYLEKLFYRGLVIKGYKPLTHLVGWSLFAKEHGARDTLNAPVNQIPKHWDVMAALRISADASKPSGYAVVARAAENAHLGECVFLVAGERIYAENSFEVVRKLKAALIRTCEGGINQCSRIYLKKGSLDALALSREKLDLDMSEFDGDDKAGISETNWYFVHKPLLEHPFYKQMGASRIYFLVDDGQLDNPDNDYGLLSARQEAVTWSYNDKQEPQPFGGIVLDCLRMLLYNFSLQETPFTKEERIEERVIQRAPHLAKEKVYSQLGQPGFEELHSAREHAIRRAKMEDEKDDNELRNKLRNMFGGKPTNRFRRK